jgi:molybdenum cofactor biosynthesis protein A, bacterial
MADLSAAGERPADQLPEGREAAMAAAATDRFQRPMRDLRVSVTDRCNFRCTYCMPKELFGDRYPFLPKRELLTFEEIHRLVRLFASLGVRKVRLTGGEPLLRRNLDELVGMLAAVDGIEDIALTTNGLLLHRYGRQLYDAGLRRVNISLDALDPDIFGRMNGRGIDPARILENIEFAVRLGFEVKVNMVVQKGMNDGEIIPMAEYFKNRSITLRFIEFMDAGNDNGWSFEKVVTKREMLQKLQQVYELKPEQKTRYGEVAGYYRYGGSEARIGFITSVSETFCSTCTRARLSSEGKLYTCLFASDGFDLREMLRGGASDGEILQAIAGVWRRRADRYSEERTAYTAQHRKKIGMSYIGG